MKRLRGGNQKIILKTTDFSFSDWLIQWLAYYKMKYYRFAPPSAPFILQDSALSRWSWGSATFDSAQQSPFLFLIHPGLSSHAHVWILTQKARLNLRLNSFKCPGRSSLQRLRQLPHSVTDPLRLLNGAGRRWREVDRLRPPVDSNRLMMQFQGPKILCTS